MLGPTRSYCGIGKGPVIVLGIYEYDMVHIQCSDDLIMNRNLGLKNEERERRRIEKICGVIRGTDFREEIN